jgi:hypothetical protein
MDFSQVVSTTVYLDDLADTKEFDRVYQEYFGPVLPARSIVQQIKPGDRKEDAEGRYPDLEQLSLIAVKKRSAAQQ